MYKMIGPALVRQDTLEAQSNVSKRLEFIGGGRAREGAGRGREGGGQPCPVGTAAAEAFGMVVAYYWTTL